MRKTLFLPLLVLLLLWQVPSYANSAQDAEFQRGFEAYHLREYEEAFEIWKPLAESGHGPAQYYLAGLYEYGRGVAKDEYETERWNRLAVKSLKLLAERGDTIAPYYLGEAYLFGYGVAKDKSEAKKWYLKAAEQKHKESQKLIADWEIG